MLNLTSVTSDSVKSHDVASYNFTFDIEPTITGNEIWIDWPSNFYQLFQDPPFLCTFDDLEALDISAPVDGMCTWTIESGYRRTTISSFNTLPDGD